MYVFRYSFRTCQCDTKHSPTISTKIPEHSCRNASRACSSADDRCHCAGARLTSLAILTTSQRIIAFSEKWRDLFVSHKQCRLSYQLAYVNRDNIRFCRVGMSLWFAYRTTYTQHAIRNGNRTLWSPIQAESGLVITNHVREVSYSFDYHRN